MKKNKFEIVETSRVLKSIFRHLMGSYISIDDADGNERLYRMNQHLISDKEINHLKDEIEKILSDNKALEIKSINLKDKTSIADFMIIASGNSSRHIQALSRILIENLKKKGIDNCKLEGGDSSDWKLIDAQDIIIHIFHPEKRKFYDLERMWSELIPKERLTI